MRFRSTVSCASVLISFPLCVCGWSRAPGSPWSLWTRSCRWLNSYSTSDSEKGIRRFYCRTGLSRRLVSNLSFGDFHSARSSPGTTARRCPGSSSPPPPATAAPLGAALEAEAGLLVNLVCIPRFWCSSSSPGTSGSGECRRRRATGSAREYWRRCCPRSAPPPGC